MLNYTFEEYIPHIPTQIFISVIVALIVTWRAIPLIINICENTGILSTPIKRSSHATPTPVFGGIAIYAGMIIGYFLWNFGDEGHLMHRVIAGVTILFFLGIKDDLYALSATKKLAIQLLVSAMVVIGSDLRITDFFGILGIHAIPYLISIAITILVFAAVTNAFNLIDGIDGLSAGIGMIASTAFGWWFLQNKFYSMACLALCLSAGLLAFIRFNFSPHKRIFMGDTGSLLMGFLITVFAVKFIHYNVNYSFAEGTHFVSAPILALTLLSVPIFDTVRVFGHRILRGKSPFAADRNHMHHLLVDVGLSHMAASLLFYLFTIIFTVGIYSARTYFTNTQLVLAILAVFGVYVIIGYRLEIERLNQAKTNRRNVRNHMMSEISETKLNDIAKNSKN